MELGEKIRIARQETGMSQRQLCGDTITRNMLSQIEHGTARPSMDTLRYLASRLGKPVSWFLDENTVTSPNQTVMADIRRAYGDGAFEAAWEMLCCYETNDEIYDREYHLLTALVLLELAGKAIADDRIPYARELLGKAKENEQSLSYCRAALRRERWLLQSRLSGEELADACRKLPPLDGELLIRAENALNQKQPERAEALLTAAEDRESPRWNLLMGQAQISRQQYRMAADHLKKAEPVYPEVCAPLLETCYRELGDYRQAYAYACKQR